MNYHQDVQATLQAFRELLLALVQKEDDEIKVAFQNAIIVRPQTQVIPAEIGATLDTLLKEVNDNVISNIMYRAHMKSSQAWTDDPEIRRDFDERAARFGSAKLTIANRYSEELPQQFAKFLKLTDFWG